MAARDVGYLEYLSLVLSAMYRLYYAGRIPPQVLTYGLQTIWPLAIE